MHPSQTQQKPKFNKNNQNPPKLPKFTQNYSKLTKINIKQQNHKIIQNTKNPQFYPNYTKPSKSTKSSNPLKPRLIPTPKTIKLTTKI